MTAPVRGWVVMVSQNFFPVIGGAENQALELSALLVEQGMTVHVLTQRAAGLPRETTVRGVTVHRLWAPGWDVLRSAFFMASVFVWLARRARDVGVVHVHLASSHAVAAGLFGRLFRKPVVVKLGGGATLGEITLSRRSVSGRLKIAVLSRLRIHLIVVGHDQRQQLAGNALETLEWSYIPNGVNTRVFHPADDEERRRLRGGLGWSGFMFLFVGRFTVDKLPVPVMKSLLAAFSAVRSVRPEARLCLVGQGPLEGDLRALIKDGALEDAVTILGARPDTASLYQAADAFVLPSLTEGLSNALLEALASGLPVVASRVPGIAAIVKEGNEAFLFDPLNPAQIESAMREAMADPERWRRMGDRARAAADAYTLERTAQRTTELYASLQGRILVR